MVSETLAFSFCRVAYCHGSKAEIDYTKGDASLQMHGNEIHAELQICLLQKCQWTML